jgi:hypothetical protein
MSYNFTSEILSASLDWHQYRSLIDEFLEQGLVTGPKQSESLAAYTRMNVARMKRIEKTTRLTESLEATIQSLNQPITFVAITEGWCGDAAQILPVINKIAIQSEKISFKLLLRDENIAVMDGYLTNGARSIPIIIILDSTNLTELHVWGPRPDPAVQLFQTLRNEGVDSTKISEELHRWYANDKSKTLISEFEQILRGIIKH